MISWPKFKRCPSCDKLNVVLINGISYKNNFKSLQEWTLKKVFKCRKCKAEVGIFLHTQYQHESIIWIDCFKFEDNHYDNLIKLEKEKRKYLKYKSDKKYNSITKEIREIQNKIRLDQIKLKVKFKIERKVHVN
jgi:hypothetical protein